MATPTPTLVLDLIRRVTYSKYLLRRATALQREGNELATAEAVLVAHDGAEMLMRVVADSVGAKPADRFMQFWQNVMEKTSIQPPHKASMDRFNDLRVGFKHKGNLPNRSVADDLLQLVTVFCHEIASVYLKMDYETVSLADLIPNGPAREEVKKAEVAFTNGDTEKAFLGLGVAYDKLYEEAQKTRGLAVLQGHRDRWDQPFLWSGEAERYAKALHIDKMAKELQRLIDITNSLVMRIQPQDLRRFNWLTPNRRYHNSGEVTAMWSHQVPALGREDFEFCHEFVIKFALRLQTL